MKKLINNFKAAAAQVSVVVLIVIVIIAGLGYYFFTTSSSNEYYTTDWTSGDMEGGWSQDVEVEFDDGSKLSMSQIKLNPLGTIYQQGSSRPVVGIRQYLKAKATGVGYNSVEYNINNVWMNAVTKRGSTTVVNDQYQPSSIQRSYSVDGSYHTIRDVSRFPTRLPSSLTPGDYTVTFSCSGTIDYRGDGDSSWQSISVNPPNVVLYFTV
jgi:hypothetical protein